MSKDKNDEKFKKQLGDKLRTLRNIKGFTQDNIASDLNITSTAYGKIERGETDVSICRLNEIAQILEVKLHELLNFENPIKNPYNNDEPVLEPELEKKKIANKSDLEIALERITELKMTIHNQNKLIENLELRIAYLENELKKCKQEN